MDKNLHNRLDYAIRLIELMGKEIVAYTPASKKRQAIKDLEMHLKIVKCEVNLDERLG